MNFNEKTVFVIDHTSAFAKPSGDEIVIEPSGKQVVPPKTVYKKSIWANVVDAVLQYCRIVYDIFSVDKSVSEPHV